MPPALPGRHAGVSDSPPATPARSPVPPVSPSPLLPFEPRVRPGRAVFPAFALSVLLAAPAPGFAGDASFREVILKTGGRVDGTLIEDVDGDGRKDLVVLEERRVVLHLQGKDGFAGWPAQVMALPEAALVVDVGDRRNSPGKEFVYITAGGVFALPWEGKRWGNPVPWAEGETCLRRGKGIPLVRDFFTDLDGDGLDDLIVPAPRKYAILRQNPDGSFARWSELDVAPAVNVWVPPPGQLGAMAAALRYPPPVIGDFDGDGRRDVAVRAGETLRVFLGREGAGPSGAPDLVLPTGFGTQNKTLGGRLQVDFDPPLFIGDLTGEGVLDLVACMPFKGEAVVIGRKGGRTAGEPTFVFRMDGWPLAAMIRDLDGRNGPDLIIGGIGEVGIWSVLAVFLTKEVVVHAFFFLNRGGGRFPKEPDREWEVRVPLKFATTAKGFRIGTSLAMNIDGDFDGDGRRDLVARRGNVILDIFRGCDEGVFEREPWTSVTIPDAEAYRYVFPETADFNGDGISDILLHYRDWTETRDSLVLYLSKR
jgi:hypothetical protein